MKTNEYEFHPVTDRAEIYMAESIRQAYDLPTARRFSARYLAEVMANSDMDTVTLARAAWTIHNLMRGGA